MAEIDERYKRGIIYTIRNIKDDTMIYVGSTINNLSKRFDSHKRTCKAGTSFNLYKHIENNDWTDWYIELYEAYPCNNKKELNQREGQVIREIGSINKCIAGRTKKEYYNDNAEYFKEINKTYYEDNAEKYKKQRKEYYNENAEKYKEYSKTYYENNADIIKEKRKEKVCCDICGVFSTKNHLARHQKSKKCVSKIPNNTDIPSDNHIRF